MMISPDDRYFFLIFFYSSFKIHIFQLLNGKLEFNVHNFLFDINWECLIACIDLVDMVLHFSFAQWQYRSQWGLSEARLLLIENYTQYPALTAWNTADFAIFVGFYGSQLTSSKLIKFFKWLQWYPSDLRSRFQTECINWISLGVHYFQVNANTLASCVLYCYSAINRYNDLSIGVFLVRRHCWCSGIMQDSHSCDLGSIPGQCMFCFVLFFFLQVILGVKAF